MYISYTKLWKFLLDKGMNKTDLIDVAGINSRTLAKLSKNQSVTTDTLLQICCALNCDIADIVEACEGEEKLSIYETFKKSAKQIDKDEYCTTYSFIYNDREVLLRKTNQSANSHTFIKCCDNATVVWERLYPIGRPASFATETKVIATAASLWKKDTVCIVLISGKPGSIDNLDEGWFVSSRGTPKGDKYIYVMSQAAFKLFEPK
ncbi:MAG: helix-turn-helix transcriptional regulator [Clostridia bacterium]|nr:helix-turn-helix transcriptional regulator [Clostridia bacterium]